jgi:hypothetical protein
MSAGPLRAAAFYTCRAMLFTATHARTRARTHTYTHTITHSGVWAAGRCAGRQRQDRARRRPGPEGQARADRPIRCAAHAHARIHTRASTRAHSHTRIFTRAHTRTRTFTHAYSHARIHALARACTDTYTHAQRELDELERCTDRYGEGRRRGGEGAEEQLRAAGPTPVRGARTRARGGTAHTRARARTPPLTLSEGD